MPGHLPSDRRAERLYVVVGYPLPIGLCDDPLPAVRVLGTVRARNRATADPAAAALSGERLAGDLGSTPWVVRWRVAGSCRRGWLLQALERDGAALLAHDRRRGRVRD